MRNHWFWRVLAAASLIVGAPAAAAQDLVLTNVHVLTMASDQVLLNHTVVVRDGLIAEITQEAQQPDGVYVVDGAGAWVVPGLIDAHVHIDHPQDLEVFPLYGVTTVVNMRGLPWHLTLREKARGGGLIAPDFITSGDYLDGNPPNMLPMTVLSSPEDARETVIREKLAGYDFIKVYSELSRPQYQAICATAREVGLAVAGHIPDAVSLDDVLTCPHRNIAHGEQAFKLLNDRQDPEEISALLEALKQAEVTLTANHQLLRMTAAMPAGLDDLLGNPARELLHPVSLQPYRPGFNRYARRDQAWVGRALRSADDVAAIAGIAGALAPQLLIAGTDTPVPGAYPGASLVGELLAYEAAGLDTRTALKTATAYAGKLVAALAPDFPRVGVLEPGARADLLMIEKDPRDGLAALKTPKAVVLRGRWLGAEDLTAHRDRLARINRAAEPKVSALTKLIFAGDPEAANALFDEYRAQDPAGRYFSQYPAFFYGFRWLYGEEGLTRDPAAAALAVQHYRLYRKQYPEFHSAHHVYGLALEAAGDLKAAATAQRRALAITPRYHPALEALERLALRP
ncbi:MAG: hypothetical protein AAGA23_00575 [Pseudomonadota bacterium]